MDYYIRIGKEYDKLIEYWNLTIDLWLKTSYFHVIHGYLEKWDYEKASEVYCEWKQLDNDITFFDDKDNIEELYFTWWDIWIVWSIECVIWFYRKQFELNWYDENYFMNMLEVVSWWDYDYNDEDKIFFDLYDKECEEIENSDYFLYYLDNLFTKFAYYDFAWFVDKILIVISKSIRDNYDSEIDIEIKKNIRMWLEKIILIEQLWLSSLDETNLWLLAVHNSKYENELLKLQNTHFDGQLFKARFDELVLKFSLDILSSTPTYSDDLNIASSLASIFEFYWLYDPMNEALEYDKYIMENKVIKKT